MAEIFRSPAYLTVGNPPRIKALLTLLILNVAIVGAGDVEFSKPTN